MKNTNKYLFLPNKSKFVSIGDIGAGFATGGIYNAAKGILPARSNMAIDTSGLTNSIMEASRRQRGILGTQAGLQAPITGAFQSGVAGAGQQYQTQAQQSAADFLKQISDTTGEQAAGEEAALKAKVYGELPSLSKMVQERAASGPGAQSGAALAGQEALAQKGAEEIASGLGGIEQERLAATQQAQGEVFKQLNDVSQQVFGTDVNTLRDVYNNSTQDVRQQIADQLGIDQNELNNMLQVQEFGVSGELAQNLGNQQAQNQLISSVLGLGGTLGGMALMRGGK